MNLFRRIEDYLMLMLKKIFCIRSIDYTDKVYLTFDDGLDSGITEYVLDLLKEYDIRATFFCIGNTIKNNKCLYDRVLSEGHIVASHTMTHLKGKNTRYYDYCNEVMEFAALYKTKLFRPPYESLTIRQLLGLKLQGFKIVLWSHDSTDWYPDVDASFDIKRILDDFTSGSIILFHSCEKHKIRTKKILPLVLMEIKRRGLKCDVISPNI